MTARPLPREDRMKKTRHTRDSAFDARLLRLEREMATQLELRRLIAAEVLAVLSVREAPGRLQAVRDKLAIFILRDEARRRPNAGG